jgi:hypothetical protein
MKNDNIIKLEVTAEPGSVLEKMIHQFLKVEKRTVNE